MEGAALSRSGVPPELPPYVWAGWGRVPLEVTSSFGPVGGVVYMRSKSRMWSYDIKASRVSHVAGEAYWDAWGGVVHHGNFRASILVPDMVNPAYSCALGPVFRRGTPMMIFLYAHNQLCLAAPIDTASAEKGLCPFRKGSAEVFSIADAFPMMSAGGGASPALSAFAVPDCATGEWLSNGEGLFMAFKGELVCYFRASPAGGVGSEVHSGPFRLSEHFAGLGQSRVDAAWGPCEVLEHLEDSGRWRGRMVVMLVCGKEVFEVDVTSRKFRHKQRSFLGSNPFDVLVGDGEWTNAETEVLEYDELPAARAEKGTEEGSHKAGEALGHGHRDTPWSRNHSFDYSHEAGSFNTSRGASFDVSQAGSFRGDDVASFDEDPTKDDVAATRQPSAGSTRGLSKILRMNWKIASVAKPPPRCIPHDLKSLFSPQPPTFTTARS